MTKKLPKGWIRDTSQENDTQVFRWYEKPSMDATASLVEGNHPNEVEWRVSGDGFNSFTLRGDKRKMLARSDEQNITKIEILIHREKRK